VQRWLQLVLSSIVVANLVVIVLGASIALENIQYGRAGAMSVAFLNAATLGENVAQFIVSWTGLDTFLGTIARIGTFSAPNSD
jgi:hypothetical protein